VAAASYCFFFVVFVDFAADDKTVVVGFAVAHPLLLCQVPWTSDE
jgi:hypothetical protein